MTVVEPGPGMGCFTLELARLVGLQGRVVAIDVQPTMLLDLRRRAGKAGLLDRWTRSAVLVKIQDHEKWELFPYPEDLHYLFHRYDPVGASPVDPSAAPAGLEVVLSFVDVRRDPFPGSGPADAFQQFVASQASGEDTSERIDGEVLHDLPELILITVARYEEVIVTGVSAPDQLQVPGEDHATASGRHLDEILVRYRREVCYVASQEAQPCGQFSQHDIGDESGLHENPTPLFGIDVSIDPKSI